MGNCMFSASLEAQNSRNILEPNNLRSRFEATGGALFLYKSIILRNYINAQTEVRMKIENQDKKSATFALKRQKIYELFLKDIEDQLQILSEMMKSFGINKKKRHSFKVLSVSHGILDEIDFLVKLENSLQEEKDVAQAEQIFEELFIKHKLDNEEIEEMISLIDLNINYIPLTKSRLIKKSEVARRLTSPQTSNP